MSTPNTGLPIPRQYLPIAIGAGLIILAMVALVTLQLASRPTALRIAPTAQVETRATEASSLSGLPVSSQAPSSTPVPIRLIDAYAAPGGVVLGPFDPAAEPFTFVGRYGEDWAQIQRADSTRIWLRRSDLTLDALDEGTLAAQPDLASATPPQTGRGLGLTGAGQNDQGEQTPAAPATYLDNVGAQAPHCVRSCDGQPGPSGGDYVIVPTLAPAYAQTIGEQAPHKIR